MVLDFSPGAQNFGKMTTRLPRLLGSSGRASRRVASLEEVGADGGGDGVGDEFVAFVGHVDAVVCEDRLG